MDNNNFDDSPLLKEVVAIIKAQTAGMEIKTETLAINAGLSQEQLLKIFHEQQVPTLDHLDTLCKQLGMELHSVIKEAANRHPGRFAQASSNIFRSSQALKMDNGHI